MAKTTLVWLCLYVGGLLTAFIKGPIYGLLVYFYTFYTQYSWGGTLKRKNWSLWASLTFMAAYLLRKSSEEKLSHFRTPHVKWLLLYLLNMIFVGFWAVDPDANNKEVIAFAKVIVLYYLIVCIVRTRMHYRMVIWLQVWGNFLFGWQGFHHKLTGGRLEGIGGPATNHSNGLANHLIMILPFLNNLFFYGNKWERLGAFFAAPWILNAIILCNSRAAFLGMVAIGILALVRSDKQVRKKILAGMIVGMLLFVYLADDRFWTRMDTIDDENQRGSGRLDTWLAAVQLIQDHPLGVGGAGFVYLSPVYIPGIVDAHGGQKRSVHNSYLKVTTNYGIQGLIIYCLFLAGTIRDLKRMRKREGSGNDDLYQYESTAIEIAIWGFMVTATFGARPYLETLFWFCALANALSNIQQSEIKDRERKVQSNANESSREPFTV